MICAVSTARSNVEWIILSYFMFICFSRAPVRFACLRPESLIHQSIIHENVMIDPLSDGTLGMFYYTL